MYGVSGAQQQGFQAFRGSTFTISCSIQPQYPGGSFAQLLHSQLHPASCQSLCPLPNFSSESRLLSVTVTGVPSDPEPFIIRAVVLPLTQLLVAVGLYFYCKVRKHVVVVPLTE
ncbi:hypothetical protein KUCAC02_028740 [Chaenocephalus aceratus]|uniref:Uncharacterized protein n=1 Tax=Chaenocephalus aceratus TaxID=36190 RepID=A0ACB9X4B9_CHAAC|nr:hypothetical protein KUCAC02_028740 [Chaenocephalus aceratus]